MDIKFFVRAGAIGFAALAIVAVALDTRLPPASLAQPQPLRAAPSGTDPIQAELALCQSMGLVAAGDQGCLYAWAENRRRFLGATGLAGKEEGGAGAGGNAPAGGVTPATGGRR